MGASAVWCDPPPLGRPRVRRLSPPRRTRWARRIEVAMERPGEWVRVRDDFYSPDSAYQAAKGLRGRSLAPDRTRGDWQFRAGQLARGMDRWGVWARWSPEEETP